MLRSGSVPSLVRMAETVASSASCHRTSGRLFGDAFGGTFDRNLPHVPDRNAAASEDVLVGDLTAEAVGAVGDEDHLASNILDFGGQEGTQRAPQVEQQVEENQLMQLPATNHAKFS